MKPNYQIVVVDLAVVRNAEAVVPIGQEFESVLVVQLPGAGVEMAFGGAAFFPLLAQGQSFNFVDTCNNPYPCNEGLFISNPAGAGVVLLMVSGPNKADA